jgi:hypothetical protein
VGDADGGDLEGGAEVLLALAQPRYALSQHLLVVIYLVHLVSCAGNLTGNTIVGGIFVSSGANLKLRGSLVDGMSRSGSTIELEGYNLIGSPTDEYTETTNPGTNIFGRDARLGRSGTTAGRRSRTRCYPTAPRSTGEPPSARPRTDADAPARSTGPT